MNEIVILLLAYQIVTIIVIGAFANAIRKDIRQVRCHCDVCDLTKELKTPPAVCKMMLNEHKHGVEGLKNKNVIDKNDIRVRTETNSTSNEDVFIYVYFKDSRTPEDEREPIEPLDNLSVELINSFTWKVKLDRSYKDVLVAIIGEFENPYLVVTPTLDIILDFGMVITEFDALYTDNFTSDSHLEWMLTSEKIIQEPKQYTEDVTGTTEFNTFLPNVLPRIKISELVKLDPNFKGNIYDFAIVHNIYTALETLTLVDIRQTPNHKIYFFVDVDNVHNNINKTVYIEYIEFCKVLISLGVKDNTTCVIVDDYSKKEIR